MFIASFQKYSYDTSFYDILKGKGVFIVAMKSCFVILLFMAFLRGTYLNSLL